MKYYYDCPIEAAYMSKYHGIYQQEPLAIGFNAGEYVITRSPHLGLSSDTKYYIHPDSLHLLEPHIGDVCRTNKKLDTGFDDVILIEDKSELNVYNDVDGFRIIQRNGLSFMWPEHE